MADIADVLAGFATDHPELGEALIKLAGDLQAASAAAEPDVDKVKADQIRADGIGGLVHRVVNAVLHPLSGPEQDAIAEVLAGHKPSAAAPAPQTPSPAPLPVSPASPAPVAAPASSPQE